MSESGWEAEKQHVNQPHYTAVIRLPGAVIHAVFTSYICFCGNISSGGMARWQTQSPRPPHPLLLSPFPFFHSPSHSSLKRLSHWFAFCCGESREVAQCVLVKAVPHLPGIIRQLCCKDPSLIPLRWPISHHKEVPGLVSPLRISVHLHWPLLSHSFTDTLATQGRKIFSCQNGGVLYSGGEKAKREYWLLPCAESKQAARIRRAYNKHPQLTTESWWNINYVLYSRTVWLMQAGGNLHIGFGLTKVKM